MDWANYRFRCWTQGIDCARLDQIYIWVKENRMRFQFPMNQPISAPDVSSRSRYMVPKPCMIKELDTQYLLTPARSIEVLKHPLDDQDFRTAVLVSLLLNEVTFE